MSVTSEADFVGNLCLRLSQGIAANAPALLGYTPVITWPEQTAIRPAQGRLRLRLYYRNTVTRQTSLGQPPRYTTSGTFYIQIYAPASPASSRGLLLALAEMVAGLYRGVTEPTGIWYRDVSVVGQAPTSEWISTRVVGKYQYDRYTLSNVSSMSSASNSVLPASSVTTYNCEVNVSGENAMMFSSADTIVPADPTSSEFVFAGITLAAASAGSNVAVRTQGLMQSDTWSWTPGPVFVGLNGALTQVPPTSGFSQQIGNALDPITLYLQPDQPILVGD